MLHLKDLNIVQVFYLQHIRDGWEVLHLKDLEINITAKVFTLRISTYTSADSKEVMGEFNLP